MNSRRRAWVEPITDSLARAKSTFATRNVPRDAMATVVRGAVRPRSGDIVLARISRLGNHRRIEQPDGRKVGLHPGDLIIVAYADRYATDQFESYVPRTLGPTHLVASGGIASQVQSRNVGIKAATEIVPIGLLGDRRGIPINVQDYALPRLREPLVRPRTICVLGTSMNSGKTTTIHHLVLGLARRGARPGVTKVTGTGSGNDYWVMLDAGAHRMLDFTDVGMAATFCQPMPRLEEGMRQLVWNLWAAGSGVALVEVADGVYQQETSQLLASDTFRELIDVVLLAGNDAMGVAMGVQHLRQQGVPVAAVSGAMTKSALMAREAERATHLPVWNLADLSNPDVVAPVLGIASELVAAEPEPPAPAWPIEISGARRQRDDEAALAGLHDSDDDIEFTGSETFRPVAAS